MGISFLILFFWMVISGFGILFTRHILNAILYFLALMVGVVGIYLLLEADIMAISHLILYVGGVIVLVLLGLMLSENRIKGQGGKNSIFTDRFSIFWGLIIGAGVMGIILFGISRMRGGLMMGKSYGNNASSIEIVGESFIGRFFLPFEYIGIFLLVCLIIAAYIAKKND